MKITEYAKARLDESIAEMGRVTRVYISSSDEVILEFENGRNLQLHDEEVEFQAIMFLKEEINLIKS